MGMEEILESLARGRDLDSYSAGRGFDELFSGGLSPAQSGALLMGLRAKGVTAEEMAAAVQSALRHARQVKIPEQRCIDTCGTGGDGWSSLNCSTAVAMFLADMGYKVVKHGNRAVSGSCGSADILEHLGMPFLREQGEVVRGLQERNFAFLFAPHFHPAFANVAPIRKELGISTLFNMMGPLLNPVRPSHQLVGVGQEEALELMARSLALTGVERAAVVHGAGGFDELTPCGTSQVILVRESVLEPVTLHPRDFGMASCKPRELVCGSREDSLSFMLNLLHGRGPEPMQDMVAMNLGMALYLLQDTDLFEGVRLAAHRVRQGLLHLKVSNSG